MTTSPPGRRAGAVHGERQPVAVDPRAERAQRVEHRAHRPLAGARVAVEADGAVGERGGGRHEAHDGAGQPAVDLAAAAEPVVSRRRRRARRRRRRDAERAQRVDHQRGVAGGRAPVTVAGPPASAASSRARFVIDFEPGTVTRPRTGGRRGVRARATSLGGAHDSAVHRRMPGSHRPGRGTGRLRRVGHSGRGRPRHRSAAAMLRCAEVSVARATMDPCAVGTPRRRRPGPGRRVPRRRRDGRGEGRRLQRRAHQAGGRRRRAAPARRRGHARPGHGSSARCGWCAGAWCRRGRRTRRAAPG